MNPSLHSLYSSPRPITLTVANLQDLDSIKASIATVAADTTYTGAALDGDDVDGSDVAYPLHAHIPSGQSVEMGVAAYPCATSAANAGSYVVGSTVTFTGTYGGKAATSVATVTDEDGGETIVGTTPLDSVTSILVEAQADTDGSWTFGFQDVGPRYDGLQYSSYRGLRADDAGNIVTMDESGHLDVTPFAAGEFSPVGPYRLNYTSTTVTTLTLYV